MTEFGQLWLTCANEVEAGKITKTLLDKHLVACVKSFPVNSSYWWKDKQESAQEVMLLMESRQDLFEQVEAEVGKIHSYDTFVLQAIPLIKISKNAKGWLEEQTNG